MEAYWESRFNEEADTLRLEACLRLCSRHAEGVIRRSVIDTETMALEKPPGWPA